MRHGSAPSPRTSAAAMDYGIPLLPFERDELEGRPNGEEAVVGRDPGYLAEHADVFGGLYIDQAHGGVVTILVTDDPGGRARPPSPG